MTSAGPTAVRILVTLLAVVATVGQVAYLDALAWHKLGLATPMSARMRPPFLTLMTAHAAVSVVSAVLAVALALHDGSRQRAARSLALAFAAWSYLTAYAGVTLLLRDPGGARAAFDAHFLVVEVAGLAGIVRFSSIFPRAPTPGELAPSAELPRALVPLHRASAWMTRPHAPWAAAAAVLAGLWGIGLALGRPLADAALHPVMDFVRFAAAAIVVLNLRRAWNHAAGEEVERLGWLLAALVALFSALLLFVGGNVLLAVTGWPEPPVAWRPLLLDVGLIGFLVGLAMAVLYRGRLDARRSAGSIVSWASVTALGLFLSAGLEALFSGSVMGGFSLRTGVGTIVAFAIVLSTHRALVRTVERGFFGTISGTAGRSGS